MTISQSITTKNKTFNLKTDGKLYAKGDGFVILNYNQQKLYLDNTKEIEIASDIKQIRLSSINPNVLILTDAQNNCYDIICYSQYKPKRIGIRTKSMSIIINFIIWLFTLFWEFLKSCTGKAILFFTFVFVTITNVVTIFFKQDDNH